MKRTCNKAIVNILDLLYDTYTIIFNSPILPSVFEEGRLVCKQWEVYLEKYLEAKFMGKDEKIQRNAYLFNAFGHTIKAIDLWSYSKITDTTIVRCTSLTSLLISKSTFTDNALSKLTTLTDLRIYANQPHYYSLSCLTNLETLKLEGTRTYSVKDIENLTSLRALRLDYTFGIYLNSLNNLTGLEKLFITTNELLQRICIPQLKELHIRLDGPRRIPTIFKANDVLGDMPNLEKLLCYTRVGSVDFSGQFFNEKLPKLRNIVVTKNLYEHVTQSVSQFPLISVDTFHDFNEDKLQTPFVYPIRSVD